MRRRLTGLCALAGFIGTVFAANWLVNHYGPVPVGFGLMAPAGVYVVGVAFLLRDAVQSTLGKLAVVAGIGAGAAASALVSPTLALASATAFALSELADFSVYTPLADNGSPVLAVLMSNVVGAAVDSLIFLQIAFGSQAFFSGQLVGKLWITAAVAAPLIAVRWRLRVREATA